MNPFAGWKIGHFKMLFGYLLLVVIAALAAMIALGDVQQSSSYGLPEILGALIALAGAFGNWAFGHRPGADDQETTNGKT
jgi:hypothetical protein